MHELPCDPPDYGCSEGPPLVPCRPTVKHRSHSLQRKAYICELAGSAVWLRSIQRTLLLWQSRHSCVGSLFPRSSSWRARTDRIAISVHPKLRPTSRRSNHCWTTTVARMIPASRVLCLTTWRRISSSVV